MATIRNAQRTGEGRAGILSERRFSSSSSALPPSCSTSQKLPSNDYHILWRQHSLAESPPGRVGLLEPTTTRERRCMPNRNSQPQNSKSPGGRHTTRHRRRRRVSSARVHATQARSNKRTHFLKPTADDQALGECFCPKHLPLSHATKSRCSRVAQAAGSLRAKGRGHNDAADARRTARS